MNDSAPLPHSPYFLDWAWQNKLLVLPIALALLYSLCGGCFGLAYINAIQAMRKNPLHKQAVELARDNQQVAEELGKPIEGGFVSEGTIEVGEDQKQGYADCTIPISGPLGQAKLFVKADLLDGKWTINSLKVSLEKSGQILTLKEAEEEQD